MEEKTEAYGDITPCAGQRQDQGLEASESKTQV